MIVAFDTETWPIHPGLQAPRLVCGAFDNGKIGHLFGADDTVERLGYHLDSGGTIVTHNGAYDAAVVAAYCPDILPPIFDAYDADRWTDTLVRQRLIDLRNGVLDRFKYSLADLVKRHLHIDISADKKGADAWRLRYCELDGLDPADYPSEARRYALSDAAYTLRVYEAQGGDVVNEHAQSRTAFALGLATCWGMSVDALALRHLKHRLECDLASIDAELLGAGLMRASGSLNVAAVQERVAEAFGGQPPRTEKGAVARDGDTLEAAAAKDPLLARLAERNKVKAYLTNTVPMLEQGTDAPLCARYFVVKSTGRVSSRPNAQNLPRSGGFRECIEARPGTLIAACDYSQMEMRTFAQVLFDLFGENELQASINSGRDRHIEFACDLLGITYDAFDKSIPEHKRERQFAKIPNFGLPGGMGASAFQRYAKAFGHDIDMPTAQRVRERWRAANPTAVEYFAWIGKQAGPDGTITVTQHRSQRVRAGAYFTEACNSLFQGLAADAMFDAVWRIQRECYTVPASPLYGCRILANVHDEILLEVPDDVDKASAAALRLRDVMVAAGRSWCPDVAIEASATLARRWHKDPEAEAVWDEQGGLREWKAP